MKSLSYMFLIWKQKLINNFKVRMLLNYLQSSILNFYREKVKTELNFKNTNENISFDFIHQKYMVGCMKYFSVLIFTNF